MDAPPFLFEGLDDMTTPELDRILDAAPIGIAVQAPDGKFVRANRAYLEMVGFSLEELLMRTWHEVTHPADVRAQARVMDHVRDNGKPEDFVKRYVTKAGRSCWARDTFGATDSGETVVYVVPELEAEADSSPTLVRSVGAFVVSNYKTGIMLFATAFGSIWAQYQSFVGRIEIAERRATQAERDVDTLRPLLLKLRGEFNEERDAAPDATALP